MTGDMVYFTNTQHLQDMVILNMITVLPTNIGQETRFKEIDIALHHWTIEVGKANVKFQNQLRGNQFFDGDIRFVGMLLGSDMLVGIVEFGN